MTVQTQYRTPAVEAPVPTGTASTRRPIVVGLVVMLALLAAVVVAGRIAATRTPTASPAPAAAPHELNAKAIADRGATAALVPHELNAKAIADRGATAAIAPHELNAKALADRDATAPLAGGGVQSGYADSDAVRTHLTRSNEPGAHQPGVVLRRQPHTITP